ncbi:MAG: large-conductance mechanosensitive channel protein MscL [Bacteroidales bacterium]|nr:large-conductance mechanosensitive channel protein MscL [Bacteroidales bacterium]
MKKTLKEFREFAIKGNVLDLAVAVILGGAFGKIVSSLVNDIIMPPIGLLLGNVDFKDLKWVIQDNEPVISLNYGMFLQNVVDFLLIAFSVFIMVKIAVKFQKKKEITPEQPKPTKEAQLLEEIRDLLKEKKN